MRATPSEGNLKQIEAQAAVTPFQHPMVLWSASSAGLLRANECFTEQVGFSAAELGREALLEWIHPDDRAALDARLEAGEGRARARHRTRGGEWLWFAWRVRSGPEGAVALGLSEQDSRGDSETAAGRGSAPHASLSETLEAMVHIVEAKHPGKRCSILLVDPGHEFVTVGAGPSFPAEYNDAVEGLRIGPAVGSCGTAAFWNIPIVVEDIAKDPLWKDLRGAAEIAGVSACWSHPVTTTAGEVLGAMALYDAEPKAPTASELDGLEIAARMVGLAIERNRLEEQLRQAAKLEAIGVLAGGIAHDFNNLLAVVLGNAELALARLGDGGEVEPMLQEIVAASTGATDFCNQMLAYAGRGALSTETLECNSLVREIGGLLQVTLSKQATLTFELHDSALGIRADRSQLRQVIMNLITNASEALGGEQGRIVIGTTLRTLGAGDLAALKWNGTLEPGEYIELTVTDSGAGMEPELQARIFDPFFTTKQAGRGLGLAAVQGIVLGHRGALAVESAPGAGTTMTLMLPRVPLSEEDPPANTRGTVSSPGRRLLVVDDEPKVRQVLTDMLESAGYTVLGARDGREALDLFREQRDSIDCVLLDLSMPKMDGQEVFREMVELQSDVRVILCSGFTEQEIVERFHDAGLAGLAGVLQKPTQMRSLLAKVATALSLGHPGARSPAG